MKKAIPLLILLSFSKISLSQKSRLYIDSLTKVLNLTKADDTERVNILNDLSKALWLSGNYPRAMNEANEALMLAKKIAFQKGLANAYNNIGVTYARQANYQEALNNYLISLKIRNEIGDKLPVSWTHMNIGSVFIQEGNYSEALKNYLAALKIGEEINDEGAIANSYNNIGNVYDLQGNYIEALKNYQLALKTWLIKGVDEHGISLVYDNIASIYTKQGNYAEALKTFLNVIKLNGKEGGDSLLMASSYGNMGDVYVREGKYPEALKDYFMALTIQQQSNYKYGITDSYINIGKIYFNTHKEADARDYLLRALTLAKENNIKEELKDAYNLLSRLDSSENNTDGAYRYFKLYSQVKDSIINEESSKQISRLKIQYESDKKDQQIETEELQNSILQSRIYYGITIIGIGILLFYLRARRKKKEYEHALVSLDLKALKSQLNPHFISNSLIALKSYVNKQPERANEFIVKFARLMRRMLEQSELPFISLREELETAELYLQIESLRLDYVFDFKIECDPAIDPDLIKVPPLILQPSIENAIRHGIMPKDEKGNVFIFVKIEGALLKMIVEDDGVGKKPVNPENVLLTQKKSFGLSITRKRIELLSKGFAKQGYLDLIFLPGKTVTEIAFPVNSLS